MKTKTFDLIVIGAGSGLTVSSYAASQGLNVAVIDEGPMGGTCLNRGCIPSKMLIHAADVGETIQNADRFQIKAEMKDVQFKKLIDRVSKTVDDDATQILKSNKQNKKITVYQKRAEFIEEKVVKVGSQKITADKIVIAAGTRPFVPPIEGIDDVDYLTSKDALRLKKQPKSLTIIGGGYIAAEMAHFFGAFGTKINIIEMSDRMVGNEDEEISDAFTKAFSKKADVYLNYAANKVKNVKDGVKVFMEHGKSGKTKTVTAEQVLVAVGRRPNTDLLKLKEAGYKLTEKGYPKLDAYLKTSVDGVYALGDIAGNWFFKHSANLEANYVVKNLFGKKKQKPDYTAMPHAIFSSPQVAGAGKTEQELKKAGKSYEVSTYPYRNTGMGMALRDEKSFVKVLADKKGKILGCHIIGPEASTLIHVVLPIMRKKGTVKDMTDAIYVHPALPEVIQSAFAGV